MNTCVWFHPTWIGKNVPSTSFEPELKTTLSTKTLGTFSAVSYHLKLGTGQTRRLHNYASWRIPFRRPKAKRRWLSPGVMKKSYWPNLLLGLLPRVSLVLEERAFLRQPLHFMVFSCDQKRMTELWYRGIQAGYLVRSDRKSITLEVNIVLICRCQLRNGGKDVYTRFEGNNATVQFNL